MNSLPRMHACNHARTETRTHAHARTGCMQAITHTRMHSRAHAVCSYSWTAASGGQTRVLLRSSVVRPCDAGATWTSRTSSAPWAGRCQHTSVIDAAGTIYVIGGIRVDGSWPNNVATYFKDVWGSTDGGGTGLGGVGSGLVKGYSGVSRGY